MSDERREFSQRLAAAMSAKGYSPKPGVLHKLFNSRYRGRSVAFSTVSKWLRGKTLPEQDKLQVLAELFEVPPHVLRFGGGSQVGEVRSAWPQGVSPQDQAAIQSFLALPAVRRRLVRELVEALAEPGRP